MKITCQFTDGGKGVVPDVEPPGAIYTAKHKIPDQTGIPAQRMPLLRSPSATPAGAVGCGGRAEVSCYCVEGGHVLRVIMRSPRGADGDSQ